MVDEAAARRLWRRYLPARSDGETANELVALYLPVARRVARRLAATMPPHIDSQELLSYGLMGLLHAIEWYDPARGVPFETYAETRIAGEIRDELRRLDWVPRAVREQERDLRRAADNLTHLHGREPKPSELAATLGISDRELRAIAAQVSRTQLRALDEPLTRDDEALTLAETIADDTPDVESVLVEEELLRAVEQEVAKLPERERQVLKLRLEERAFTDIGRQLNVSNTRAAKLEQKAVSRLRRTLAPGRGPLAAVR